MSARTAPTSRGIPKLRYGIALLLGFGVLINYFDRVNLSVASRALDQQFGIGAIGFGVLSSAYSYTYAALQIPVGLALDRYGVATLGRVGALIWSIASFWSGLSGSFASFLGSRLLLGVGEAPTFPGNAKAIAAWFPRSERGLATAIFDSAAKLGTGIAIPLVSVVAAQLGWRWAFYFTGGLSFVFFLLFYYRAPSRDARLGATEREYIAAGGGSEETAEPGERGVPLGYLLRNRKVWG